VGKNPRNQEEKNGGKVYWPLTSRTRTNWKNKLLELEGEGKKNNTWIPGRRYAFHAQTKTTRLGFINHFLIGGEGEKLKC